VTQYRNPVPTVDVIIEVEGGIVLIERRNPPVGWAIVGGFVDEGEPVWAAAVREAREETSLDVTLLEQFFCYSAPDRDPRQHTISVVFIARASGTPRGADDAARAAVFSLDQLFSPSASGLHTPLPLVFDHAQILGDYFHYRRTGRRPPPIR